MEVVGDLENGSREPECNGLKTVEDEYMETIKWTAIPVFGFKAQLVSKTHAIKEYNAKNNKSQFLHGI